MTTATRAPAADGALLAAQYSICLKGIVWREALRFLHQRERFISALVRPLVWLFIFAAGFRQVLGVSIIPPYDTYVLYEVYITPGLIAMIQLFNGMQSSLSMVYDREMGNMRTLLVSPFPRWYLLSSKLIAGTAVSLLQVYAFLLIAWFWEIEPPPVGYLTVLPALVLTGLMLGALGMLISSVIKQLENFAGVMNFVIFPMFFASSALYPLWRMQEGSPCLYYVCLAQSFHPRGRTHPLRTLRQGQLDFAGGGLRLYGGCSWSAPSWPMIRHAACWRVAGDRRATHETCSPFVALILVLALSGPGARGRSALSRLALQSDQGAGTFGGCDLDRAADRRRRRNLGERSEIKDLVARLAARRTPLDDAEKTIGDSLAASAARTSRHGRSCCLPACSRRSTASGPRS